MFIMRTHNCNELRKEDVGKTVSLCGWLHSVRDLGAVVFFVLRDFYGITQVTASDEATKEQIRNIPRESTLRVTGKVILRSSPNPALPTGLIEVEPENIEVLGKCTEALPFEISNSLSSREDVRLKYRFLDLRNPAVKDKIVLRSKIVSSIRRRMTEKGFLEITTPILTSSSPEGARDFIVPSRLYPGQFYALPQAPQQYKQLLMASGIDRYFQIAPCFRDEDARADRSPGEFYQLDMEMAFASQEDVFAVLEEVLPDLFREFTDRKVDGAPFRRIPYLDAIRDYGSDKPDLRNPLIIKDVTHIIAKTAPMFEGKTIKAIKVDNFDKPRSFIDKTIIEQARQNEIETVYWFKTDESNNFAGGIAKFLGDVKDELIATLDLKPGSFVAVLAGDKTVSKQAGIVRTILGTELDLIEKDVYKFCWIVDFPMYEIGEESGAIEFCHNPFSMPQGGMEALVSQDPLSILAYQYDIVCNGIELSSGAVRNHDPEIMVKAFEIAGYGIDTIESKFSALYNAFKFGAPPHAGIAPGVDRIVMLLCDEPSIREVIAFPMNKNAKDLLMNAPNYVTEKQLKETHIAIVSEEK
ncbi:MAG: aspartate--tRNA ligase [Clostridiales bacterium]|nr:aspartate--tRNA ligase [Clostridiales bacterium]